MVRYGQTRLLGLGMVIVCALMVGCGGTRQPVAPVPAPAPASPPPVQATATPPPRAPQPAPPVARPTPSPTEEEIFARTSLSELNAAQHLSDIYFDYDASALSDPDRAALERDAAWMKRWTSTRVLISGHADERGTNEYNLALGERRSSAARTFLENLGIAPSRIEVVSKGKEAPFCTEHNDECWSENRRAHFIITAK